MQEEVILAKMSLTMLFSNFHVHTKQAEIIPCEPMHLVITLVPLSMKELHR
jgi:hypothetical protein